MDTAKPALWRRCQLTPRDRRNQQRTLIWLFVWVVSWVVANFAIKEGWTAGLFPAPLLTIPVLVLGIIMMLAYWKFIREADELQRKIQLEGLALGFGVGLVGAYTIHLLARADLTTGITFGDVGALMIVAYSIAVVIGDRRYA